MRYPEGTEHATRINVQLPCLQKDLRTGSISRDIVNLPSELCRRRSGVFTEVARLVPPRQRPSCSPWCCPTSCWSPRSPRCRTASAWRRPRGASDVSLTTQNTTTTTTQNCAEEKQILASETPYQDLPFVGPATGQVVCSKASHFTTQNATTTCIPSFFCPRIRTTSEVVVRGAWRLYFQQSCSNSNDDPEGNQLRNRLRKCSFSWG